MKMTDVDHKQVYWLVLQNRHTGEFESTQYTSAANADKDTLINEFESKNPIYFVLETGIGDVPKPYQGFNRIDKH